MDYRGLNKVTKKNRYSLSLILKLLEQLGSAKIFTKIDLRGTYNLVQVKEGDEWKTLFHIKYGHFEYLICLLDIIMYEPLFEHMISSGNI